MEISGYPHYENVCSNILKFYLNPKNEHELKDLVINSLARLIDKNFKFDIDFEEVEILREIKTINDKRLDLLILTENYAIGIENKIFHHLHNDLGDYNNTVNSYCYNSRKPICIVLSLNKLTSVEDIEKINNSNFINITYEQIFLNIKKNIGKHLSSNNLSYVNHLNDFMKTIENLTPKTMENRALWAFFKNNSEAIQELTDGFTSYRNSLYQQVYRLNETLPQSEFAPLVKKQWIWDGRREGHNKLALVHDYKINNLYFISIDTCIDINGWEIQLFGRNNQSAEYLFNIMCQNKDFLPQPLENFERNDRLIYFKFDTDAEIAAVAQKLTDLLARIEQYKIRTEGIVIDNLI